MTTATTRAADRLVLHAAAPLYDRLAWLLTLGRERAMRERLAALAELSPGQSVLDVGCGTGSLALVARRRVGAGGAVHGVDASPAMIARARRKAGAKGLDVAFAVARAQALPFPDAHFDVVLCTLMLHHLPRAARAQCMREIRRVLAPGGRVLAVDFEPGRRGGGLLSRLHRHGHVPLEQIVALLQDAGLRLQERGTVGLADLRYALAGAPGPADAPAAPAPDAYRTLAPLPTSRWVLVAAAVALLAGHGLVLRVATSRLALPALVLGAGVLVAAAAHGALIGVHGARGRR